MTGECCYRNDDGELARSCYKNTRQQSVHVREGLFSFWKHSTRREIFIGKKRDQVKTDNHVFMIRK